MPFDYDALAWFYDRYWGSRFHDAAAPALERLLYRGVPPGARVLDLCCGSGHASERLARRGYMVVGVDRSLAMLRLAQRRVPQAALICADATAFSIAPVCAAALCTFDSVNHVMTDTAVCELFQRVNAALEPGGPFVFDVNTDDAYRCEWARVPPS